MVTVMTLDKDAKEQLRQIDGENANTKDWLDKTDNLGVKEILGGPTKERKVKAIDFLDDHFKNTKRGKRVTSGAIATARRELTALRKTELKHVSVFDLKAVLALRRAKLHEALDQLDLLDDFLDPTRIMFDRLEKKNVAELKDRLLVAERANSAFFRQMLDYLKKRPTNTELLDLPCPIAVLKDGDSYSAIQLFSVKKTDRKKIKQVIPFELRQGKLSNLTILNIPYKLEREFQGRLIKVTPKERTDISTLRGTAQKHYGQCKVFSSMIRYFGRYQDGKRKGNENYAKQSFSTFERMRNQLQTSLDAGRKAKK